MRSILIIALVVFVIPVILGQIEPIGEFGDPSDFLLQSEPQVPVGELEAAKDSLPLSHIINPVDNIYHPSLSGLVPNALSDSIFQNSLSDITGIVVNDAALSNGFFLEFRKISSMKPSNFIPTLNLIDDSLTSFILDPGEFASVSQLVNGLLANEYRATLSKGAQVFQKFKDGEGQILFQATDDASFFIKKGNIYEFEKGIFTFVNKDYREILETDQKARIELDINTGFIKITLPKNSSYTYEDLEDNNKNFKIQNKNDKNHIILIKKRLIDSISDTDYIDFIEHKIKLTGKINLFAYDPVKEEYLIIYESLSELNNATLDLDKENEKIELFFLDTTSKFKIANIFTSYYQIEESYNQEFIRHIFFNKKVPRKILKYKIITDPVNEINLDSNEELFQYDNYDIIAKNTLAFEKCNELLKELIKKNDPRFIQAC